MDDQKQNANLIAFKLARLIWGLDGLNRQEGLFCTKQPYKDNGKLLRSTLTTVEM